MKTNGDPLAGKRDVESCLHRAVRNYVKKFGGNVVVTGGIQIIQWPDEPKGNFSVALRCTGIKPELKK